MIIIYQFYSKYFINLIKCLFANERNPELCLQTDFVVVKLKSLVFSSSVKRRL